MKLISTTETKGRFCYCLKSPGLGKGLLNVLEDSDSKLT